MMRFFAFLVVCLVVEAKFQVGKILEFSSEPQNSSDFIYFNNETRLYEGLLLGNETLDVYNNEIIYSFYSTEQEFDDLVNESRKRVELARSISQNLQINSTNLILNSINLVESQVDSFKINHLFSRSHKAHKILEVSISDSSLIECNTQFVSNQLRLHLDKNAFIMIAPLKNPLYRVKIMYCEHKNSSGLQILSKDLTFKEQLETFIPGNHSFYQIDFINEDLDHDFIVSVVVPFSIILAMLTLSIALACILHRLNKKTLAKHAYSKHGPIYKQKSYLTKGVPVILYDEMTDKPMEDEGDYLDHRKPLIMKNEKPPQPAPPEYRKSSNLLNDNENVDLEAAAARLEGAPLALAESTVDDTFAFLNKANNQKKEDLFYEPPQPIVTLKDVSRRLHTTQSQHYSNQQQQQQPQLLP